LSLRLSLGCGSVHVGLHRSVTALQGDFGFLRAPRAIGQRLRDVLAFQVGILAENLFPRPTGGHEADDGSNRDTHAPDATHEAWVQKGESHGSFVGEPVRHHAV
jgi:hypothetical protein